MSDTTLHYPWDLRPGYEPLTHKEAILALKIADYDAEQAATLLKVDTSRLMGFLRGRTDLYRQVELKTVYPFISIRERDDGIMITIKPNRSYQRVTPYLEADGTVVIKLDKVSREHGALVQRAEAVVRESK